MPKLDEGRFPGSNSQNEERGSALHLSSTFNLNRTVTGTRSFGRISPSFVFRGERGDSEYYHPIEEHQSYTLKAPLMQDIDHYKDFYLVTKEAILPNNWQKVYEQPKLGDDTPKDDAGADLCYCSFPVEYFANLTSDLIGEIQSAGDYSEELTFGLRALLVAEMFYSEGSLLKFLGYNLCTSFSCNGKSIDQVFDAAVSELISQLIAEDGSFYLDIGDDTYIVVPSVVDDHEPGSGYISVIDAIELMRDNIADFEIRNEIEFTGLFSDLENSVIQTPKDNQNSKNGIYLNLDKAYAYQIVCAHYYTNDNVDYIYSADLYRQYLRNILQASQPTVVPSFTYNGVSTLFDECSLGFFNAYYSDASFTDLIRYWSAVLSFRSSLRYRDFFTGAKTRPLAIGDTTIPVVNNSVSVIDTTRNIQWQRFLNAVNRIPRKLEGYLEGLIPGRPLAPDYHNPFFLAGTHETIYTVDNVNSAFADNDDPNNVRANFRGRNSQYGFQFNLDRPAVVIGVDYYDISRLYAYAAEKQDFIMNRYDMYNPYMEFIGDQSLDTKQLSLWFDSDIWAYQTRFMEYKQRFNSAYGGVMRFLPGFVFIADADRSLQWSSMAGNAIKPIGPSFIRARSTELDRFYLSLTGFSLASRFHFIVKTAEELNGKRAMAYSPNILS